MELTINSFNLTSLPSLNSIINVLSRFFQQHIQKISNQTFNQWLLQDYCPPAMGPEAFDSQLYPDGEGKVLLKDFKAPIQ